MEIKTKIPPKQGFGEAVLEAAINDERIVGLGLDITNSVGMNYIKEKFPGRFFSLGIAEQNAAGVAAGLALSGKIPVFATYGVFASTRALDQIRVSICYNNLPVLIGGAHSGISVGADGATHQALEDIATIRVLPNITLISPCDYTQTKLLTIKALKQISGPVYIRFGREAVPDFTSQNNDLEIGKAQILKAGKDISIFATGNLVWESLLAAEMLEEQQINAEVINIHTIKPIDKEAILKSAMKTGIVVTAEEAQVNGGLGGAIAEVLAKSYPVKIGFIGMGDKFGESGEPPELLLKYKLDSKAIFEKSMEMLRLK